MAAGLLWPVRTGVPECDDAGGVLLNAGQLQGVRLRHARAVQCRRRQGLVLCDYAVHQLGQSVYPKRRHVDDARPRPLRLPPVRRRQLRAVRHRVPHHVGAHLPRVPPMRGLPEDWRDQAARPRGHLAPYLPGGLQRGDDEPLHWLAQPGERLHPHLWRRDAHCPRLRLARPPPPRRWHLYIHHDYCHRGRTHAPLALPLRARGGDQRAHVVSRGQLNHPHIQHEYDRRSDGRTQLVPRNRPRGRVDG